MVIYDVVKDWPEVSECAYWRMTRLLEDPDHTLIDCHDAGLFLVGSETDEATLFCQAHADYMMSLANRKRAWVW